MPTLTVNLCCLRNPSHLTRSPIRTFQARLLSTFHSAYPASLITHALIGSSDLSMCRVRD